MQRDEAVALDNTVQGGMAEMKEALVDLYTGIGWVALGFDSWTGYLSDRRIPFDMVRISPEVRRPVVEELSSWGWTQQRVANALGVDDNTVARDLEGISHMGNTFGKPTRAQVEIAKKESYYREIAALVEAEPRISRTEVMRRTGISQHYATTWAKENGHSWASPRSNDVPVAARAEGGRAKAQAVSKPPSPQHIEAPVYTRSQQLHELGELARIINLLREQNGRVKIAQDVTEAIKCGDMASVGRYAAMAILVRDYTRDIARIFEDDDYRKLLDDGVEGRDDIDLNRHRATLRAV